MKIVIIGIGKVGYKLAEELSAEDYDIVLVDSNTDKLNDTINKLDVNCFAGDGASAKILRQAGADKADLVIASTSNDETNMMICLIAREVGAANTIARVRKPVYFEQIDILKKALHLNMTVNPELVVAGEISRLLILPDASKAETFAKGRVELVESAVPEDSALVGSSLADFYSRHQIKVLVCAVERAGEVFIPSGETVLEAGDRIYIAASHRQLVAFFRMFAHRKTRIRRVMICGGGRVSYYLALRLIGLGMQVTIVEKDMSRCDELCDLLPKAMIINGDASDQDLLIEEGLGQTDAFIALTGMDEENIIMALFAKSQNVEKIIVKVNEDRRARIMRGFGIDRVVSSKMATADVILSYVRAMKNSGGSANIETVYQLVDGRIEALEFIIKSETEYTNVALKDLKMKPNNLIACIARGNQIIIPSGNDCIKVGDSVIIVTMEKRIQDLSDMML